ncbi:flavin reductase family protein [Stappia sp.]|jgi:flavin reductase (DIM6/NTAB) family NADH-FMN oxidoreductase RutF|uniref:flavin reductase family protein n=1 Tax=Stappia sp. TaxID=1870903 RepID=UPI003A98E73A
MTNSPVSGPTGADPRPVADEVDAAAFREAMSRLGSAVHIATTDGASGRCGTTVSAVTSVSDSPPSILVCVNRQARINAAIKENGVFAINTLPAHAERLSDAFAGKGGLSFDERFALAEWMVLATGTPVLAAARVGLDCRVTEITEVGTHSVIFGEVVALSLGDRGPALIYLDRAYHRI